MKYRTWIFSILAGVISALGVWYHITEISNLKNGTHVAEIANKIIHSSVIVETLAKEPKNEQIARETGAAGHGTGFFYKVTEDSAYVITNFHVIEIVTKLPEHIKIEVTVASRPWQYEAELIGYDKLTDIAVLKIQKQDNETKWEALPWYDFDKNGPLDEGYPVITVGNGLGQMWSTNTGVISATRRFQIAPFNFMIQHDAVINLGSSGGPLVNMHGEIIGVNNMIVTPGKNTKPWSGVSMAINGWQAKRSIDQIIEKGFVLYPQYGFSIEFPEMKSMIDQDNFWGTEEKRSYAMITEVETDPEAVKVGLKNGDIIIAVEDKPVWSVIHVIYEILKYDPWQSIKFKVLRDETVLTFNYKLQRLDIPNVTPNTIDVVPPK